MAAADGVRARIAKIQEEKARKEADARAASPKTGLEARLAAAQQLENERRYAMQMAQKQRSQDGYY